MHEISVQAHRVEDAAAPIERKVGIEAEGVAPRDFARIDARIVLDAKIVADAQASRRADRPSPARCGVHVGPWQAIIERAVSLKPSRRFSEGLQQTVDWYRDNEWWWAPIRSGEYREYYEKQYGRRLAG
jgi:hypothetical protein